VLGIFLGALLGGAVVIEEIFGLPGVGALLVESVSNRDFPVVQGSVLLFGAGVVVANLVTDLGYAVVDPRVRRS
jgi:peptide/nickel transport system permease protein